MMPGIPKMLTKLRIEPLMETPPLLTVPPLSTIDTVSAIRSPEERGNIKQNAYNNH
jgi:hypothetical protein